MKRSIFSILMSLFCAIYLSAGINVTLDEAQHMFQLAKSKEDYQRVKQKFESARQDVGYDPIEHDAAINDGIRKCDAFLAPTKIVYQDLTVDGGRSASASFPGVGGEQTFDVQTMGKWDVRKTPDWCKVIDRTSTFFTLKCEANPEEAPRSGQLTVKARNGREVNIQITQDAAYYYINVNERKALGQNYTHEGGTTKFYVTTNLPGWSFMGIPNWCTITGRTEHTFTLSCNANNGQTKRESMFKVYGRTPQGNVKDVMIDLTQDIMPFTMLKAEYGNFKQNGKVIAQFGSNLYSKEMRFLCGKLYYNGSPEYAIKTIYIKIFTPDGTLMTDSYSPSGYTLSSRAEFLRGAGFIVLSGYGNKSKSLFPAGTYRYEVWMDGKMVFSDNPIVYPR